MTEQLTGNDYERNLYRIQEIGGYVYANGKPRFYVKNERGLWVKCCYNIQKAEKLLNHLRDYTIRYEKHTKRYFVFHENDIINSFRKERQAYTFIVDLLNT